jgi:hypothetical protein
VCRVTVGLLVWVPDIRLRPCDLLTLTVAQTQRPATGAGDRSCNCSSWPCGGSSRSDTATMPAFRAAAHPRQAGEIESAGAHPGVAGLRADLRGGLLTSGTAPHREDPLGARAGQHAGRLGPDPGPTAGGHRPLPGEVDVGDHASAVEENPKRCPRPRSCHPPCGRQAAPTSSRCSWCRQGRTGHGRSAPERRAAPGSGAAAREEAAARCGTVRIDTPGRDCTEGGGPG